jgi:hypothetical protein
MDFAPGARYDAKHDEAMRGARIRNMNALVDDQRIQVQVRRYASERIM